MLLPPIFVFTIETFGVLTSLHITGLLFLCAVISALFIQDVESTKAANNSKIFDFKLLWRNPGLFWFCVMTAGVWSALWGSTVFVVDFLKQKFDQEAAVVARVVTGMATAELKRARWKFRVLCVIGDTSRLISNALWLVARNIFMLVVDKFPPERFLIVIYVKVENQQK